MCDKKKYFVKFVKLNENTLYSLINKTIKFSTVYEFNDFSEFGFILGPYKYNNKLYNNLKTELLKHFKDPDNISKLFNNSYYSGFYSKEYNKELKGVFIEKLKEGNFTSEGLPFLLENFIYSQVGIFCLSDISLFEDVSASLMFAHYGDSLKGIALVYEYTYKDDNAFKINYTKTCTMSFGEPSRAKKWIDEKFEKDDLKDFLSKYPQWSYEKEHRLFAKPGINKAADYSLKLVKILYTPRFNESNLEPLNEINKKIYNNELEILEIICKDDGLLKYKGKNVCISCKIKTDQEECSHPEKAKCFCCKLNSSDIIQEPLSICENCIGHILVKCRDKRELASKPL